MYHDCFHIWPDGGSFEKKHVAEFLILITIYIYIYIYIYIVVLLTGINYYIIGIHNGMAPNKNGNINPYPANVENMVSS